MVEKKPDKCAHPGCNCPARKSKKYCSTYCETVGDRIFSACECGHAECAAEEMASAAE